MKYFRNIALAASLAAGFALPAMAQTASPDATPAPQANTAPAPQASTPVDATQTPSPAMPDAGVKKAAPAPRKHTHHVAHKMKATKPGTVKKIGVR